MKTFFNTMTLPAFALCTALSSAQAAEPIMIGLAGPINGPLAAIGADMKAAADTAIDKINAAGGILGRPLSLQIADDQCTGKDAVNAANHLLSDGVGFVVGHYCSAATMPASKIYNEAGMVQITMSQGAAITQQNYTNLFRITPNAEELAKGYIKTVQNEYNSGNNRIAIVGTNDQYARDISEALQKNVKDRGMDIVLREYYSTEDKDFAAIITKLKQERINLVLLSGNEQQMGLIVRQSADLAFKPQYIVSSTALSSSFAAVAGGCNALGIKAVAAWNPLYLPNEPNVTLLRDLKAHGVNSIDTAVNVYSAVMAMAQAIERTGSTDPQAVAETLHHETFALPIGDIQFTVTGELVKPQAITYEFQTDSLPCQTVHPLPATP